MGRGNVHCPFGLLSIDFRNGCRIGSSWVSAQNACVIAFVPDTDVRPRHIDLKPRITRLNRVIVKKNSMVLLSGIEPPTSPLPRECSTTELQQPYLGGA